MIDERPNVRSLFEKTGRSMPAANASAVNIPDNPETEYTPYAKGRISRSTQLSLLLRRADGSIRVFTYAYFCGAEASEPALGFVLDFGQWKVKISGRNLEKLLSLISQHKVAEICEAERSQSFASTEDTPVVERILIMQPKNI